MLYSDCETQTAAFVGVCGIRDFTPNRPQIRFTPPAPTRTVPTSVGYIVTRAEWGTWIHRGTLAERKEYIANKRNIRLSTDLATRIYLPVQQETLEKGKKYY